MPRTLFFSFCEKRKSASCFLVGGDVVLKKEKFFAVCGLKFEWRKKTKKIALSLSLFIEEGNSVCLSALSQGSLCPLLRANTRIFAREERERGRERERRRRKSERERRESEREREVYSPALVCGCGFRFLRSKKEREEEEEEEEEGL
jgi:hypothetical protein